MTDPRQIEILELWPDATIEIKGPPFAPGQMVRVRDDVGGTLDYLSAGERLPVAGLVGRVNSVSIREGRSIGVDFRLRRGSGPFITASSTFRPDQLERWAIE